MITAENIPLRFKRSLHSHPETHAFAIGQAVRLKGGFLRSGNTFFVTATLPPIGDSPQYRIRNDTEKFERMATQADLEPVIAPTGSQSDSLIEKSFGRSQEK
jgi:hypothetical protein